MLFGSLESLKNGPISPPVLSEPELIERVLKGERKLFHDLVRPYERSVYVTAYAILRNHADAEDAAQETMLKALTHLEQLKERQKFKGWLLHIAVNEARLKRRGSHDTLRKSGIPLSKGQTGAPQAVMASEFP